MRMKNLASSIIVSGLIILSTLTTSQAGIDDFFQPRKDMVEHQLRERGIDDKRVLEVMLRVERHKFVPHSQLRRAYYDRPLPIGEGQTISQPYIVAFMTQCLKLKPTDRVLEVGTGSGYQAAILADLTNEVYTIEIIEKLYSQAKERLSGMEYHNIQVKHADGYYGWEEHAPFDIIMVTCAPDHVPPPLIRQLANGGRMILPVGRPGNYQTLWLIEKRGEKLLFKNEGAVLFVPLRRTP